MPHWLLVQFFGVMSNSVISILYSRDRMDGNSSLGGGNMYQTFTWTEKRSPGSLCLPWPVSAMFLDFQPWIGFENATVDVPAREGWDINR
jgi:hypothetical protein